MRLTLLDLPYADELVYPIATFPVRFITGTRPTDGVDWAEDENGRVWRKNEHTGRWLRCVTFRSGGAA